MKILFAIWQFLNGNKTIICLFGLWLIEKGWMPVGGAWLEILQWLFMAGAGGAFAHHVKKGYISKNKGQ